MTEIYFDNNATTKLNAQVIEVMNETFQHSLNASATHNLGRKAQNIVEESRQDLQNLLNAGNYEVTFTASGTEANNMALFGSQVDEILFCTIEHSSIFNARPDCKITEIKSLKNGIIDIADLEEKLNVVQSPNFLVSIMLANNETGAIQPVSQIAKLVHQKGGLIHSDLIQATGKIDIDLEEINIDFASVSGHKFNGPQGVGALLRRKGLDIQPIIFGGGQEGFKRSGTLNVAGIAGFGKACKLANNRIKSLQEVKDLRDYLENEFKKIAKEDVKIFSQDVERLPNTSFISLKNSSNQTQLIDFDLNQIYVSAGAACSSGSLKESRILKAMQVETEFLQGAIRVSLGIENTKEEVDKFLQVWTNFYKRTKD